MHRGTIVENIVQDAIDAAEISQEDLRAVNDCLASGLPVEFRLIRGLAVMERLKTFCLRQLRSGRPMQFMRIVLGGHLTMPMQRLNLTPRRVVGCSSEDTLVLHGATSDEVALDLSAYIILTEIMMYPSKYRLPCRCSLRKMQAHWMPT